MQTRTEGYDPQANGRAESFIGLLKHRATGLLLSNHHPVKFWYWVMRNEAYLYRRKILQLTIPEKAPTYGEKVLIKKPLNDKQSFTPKTEEAIFLAWNPAVIQGADVLVVRGGKPQVVTASAPVPWPDHLRPGTHKWNLMQGPKGEKGMVRQTGRISLVRTGTADRK